MSQNLLYNSLDLSVVAESGPGGVLNPFIFGQTGHHLLVGAEFVSAPVNCKPEALALTAFRLASFAVSRTLGLDTMNALNRPHVVEKDGKKRGLVRVDFETSIIEIGDLTTISILAKVSIQSETICDARLTFLPEQVVQRYKADLANIRVSSVRELESIGTDRRFSTAHAIKSVEAYIAGAGDEPVATKVSPRVIDVKTAFCHWHNLSSCLSVGSSIQKGPHIENTISGFSFVQKQAASFSF